MTSINSPLKIGILGCGAIAPAYLKNIRNHFGNLMDPVACADLSHDLSKKLAEEFDIPRVLDTKSMLNDSSIDIIVNLTPAPVHFDTSMEILKAGKHLFTEKPLCLSLEDASKLMAEAEYQNVCIAGASDTFLGAGLQESKSLLDQDMIGTPIGATIVVALPKYDAERYHHVFNGALLDLGPYYVTALVQLFGPVSRVTGLAPMRFQHRVDGSTGKEFSLTRPATSVASLQFENGTVATLLSSHDIGGYFPKIEIFGTKGRMVLPDANFYAKSIAIETWDLNDYRETNSDFGFTEEGRALGLAEMANALRNGSEPRSNAALMYHVLEILLEVYASAKSGTTSTIQSRVKPAQPFSYKELIEAKS